MPDKQEPNEYKGFPFELEEKGLDVEQGTFAGYAAICGNLDDGGDIIEYGAFKKTLAERGPESGRNRVKVFRFHDFKRPIGKTLEVKEVSRGRMPKALLDQYPNITGGLYVKGQISHTPDGDEVLTLMRDGVVNELSIGYDAVKEYWDEDDDTKARHLKEVKLYCADPVPLGMNAAAIITDVKELELKPEETEDYIRIPVESPGKHTDHRIRTITISAEKGIKALYCGECKVVITYLFAKEKGWTMATAKEWVKEHSKSVPWDALQKAIEGQDKVLEQIAEGPTGGYFTIGVEEEVRQKVMDAMIQRAEIQRQQIEEL